MTRLALTLIAALTPLLMATAAADPAAHLPVQETYNKADMIGRVPHGWPGFCSDHPEFCFKIPAAAPLGRDAMPTLSRINRDVNASIFRLKTLDPIGWQIAPARGDCNDFAVTKLARLVAAGVPRGALRLAAVITPKGDPHLVLVAETVSGSVVLDSLRDEILRWDRAGYRWVSAEFNLPGISMAWRLVEDGK